MCREFRHSMRLMEVWLLAMLLLVACSSSDDLGAEIEKPVPTVTAQMNFSLPNSIIGKRLSQMTRMTSDVVQESGTEESFRGIDDIHLFCFDHYPTVASDNLGNVIEMKTSGEDVVDDVTEEDYSLCQEIHVPVGTSYFAFYARAADAPKTHEERMHYGVIETVGLNRKSYSGNSSIRFRPVPICTSTDALGGSARGHALLNLLNDIMNMKGPEAAPNDKLSTVNNLYLNEAYERLKQLKTLSSMNVQVLLGVINKMVNMEGPDEQGQQLAAAITEKIASCCAEAPLPTDDQITLKEDYLGYPDDIHLPAGAARIQWKEDKHCFEPVDVQAYGKELNVMSVNDYVYPMNLQYQIFSDIVASDEKVVFRAEEESPDPEEEGTSYKNWDELIHEGYDDASKVVKGTTQSVAMVQQVQYAVGRLALRTRISRDEIYDAKGQRVDVSKGFTLKSYIVGGQREVDYNFQPVSDSKLYAIYDTDLNEGTRSVVRRTWSDDDEFNYILGLGTAADKNIYLALELVNNGPDFQGADGLILHGATFYLVADMVPQEGANYSTTLNQIFSRERATRVNLTITPGWRDKNGDGIPDPDLDEHGDPKPLNGLATATYGLPNLDIPHPTVGVSVDLSWGEGLWFDDVEL